MTVFSDRRRELMDLVYAGRLSAEEAAAQYRALTTKSSRAEGATNPPSVSQISSVTEDAVAIVGMAGRFPGADDVNGFWELLATNRSAVVDVSSRWPEIDEHYSSDLTDLTKAHCRWGGLMKQIDDFDPLFFELSPRQAQLMEPRQRLLLMESWKALEDAGHSRRELDGKRCGIFVGCEGSSEYFDRMRPERMDGNAVLGHSNSVLSARLAYFMNLRGPSMTVDTACSSSLVAIHLACQAIRDGSADLALAGGVTVMLSMGQQLLQSRMGMLSPQGRCKTFDASADGFVPAECAAMVVLKPLSAAVRDKNHVYGVIRGSAINQDGRTNGITAPSSLAQQELIERAVAMSGVPAEAVRYVEAHGTGTRLGDPIEVEALARTYGAARAGHRVGIGSVKTNIGHASAASGVASLIKLILAMEHDLIPASLNCAELNPRIDLGADGLYIVRDNEPLFPGPGEEVVTAVSSFGYSGTNAHLVVSSARSINGTRSVRRAPIGGRLPFFVSAASAESLRLLCTSYRQWLTAAGSTIEPTQLTLQTLALRTPMRYRAVLHFHDLAELVIRLGELTEQDLIATHSNPTRTQALAVEELIEQALAVGGEDPDQLVTLLNQIAEGYYRDGVDGPYHRLAQLVDQRMHLPTYPFASSRFDLDKDDLMVADPTVVAADQAHRVAPSVGLDLRELVDGAMECVLTGDEPFLRDHSGVLPGVMYLELFRAAAAAHAPQRRVAALRNVSWIRLMHVPLEAGIRLRISVHDRSPEQVELAVQLPGQPPFATAQAEYGPTGPTPQMIAESEITTDLDGSHDAVAAYRALLAANGVGVGPTFRGVRRIRTDGVQLMGELGLDEPVAGIDGFQIHPSFVDGGFSAIAAWICDLHPDEKGLYVPFSLGRLEFFDLAQPLHSVMVRRSHEPTGEDIATAGYELNYLSAAGDVVMRMEGMYLRRVQPIGDSPAASAKVVALTESWQEAEAVEHPDEARLLIAIARSAQEADQFRRALGALSIPNVIAAHGVDDGILEPGEVCLARLDEECLGEFITANILPGTSLRFLLLGAPAEDESVDRVEAGVLTILSLVRALLRKPINSPVDIVLLSFGDPREQAVSGFLRTMNLEKPMYRGRVVTMDRTAEPVTVLRREASRQTGGYDVRHHRGVRQELVLERLPGVQCADGDGAYAQGGTFLVAGGAGGLGLALAGHLFAHGAVRVYICGRSPLSGKSQAEVKELQRQGHPLTYLQCDITDRQQVAHLVELLGDPLADNPVLDGIFHTAGVLRDRFILAKDRACFREVIAPKTTGTDLLVAAAKELGAPFVCFFSSTSSVLGNLGQCDYSFGNRYLDVLAQRESSPSLRLLSLNWSVWAGGGMQIPEPQLAILAERYGLIPLPLETGFAAMDACIAGDHRRTVLLHGDEAKILGNFFNQSQPTPATPPQDVEGFTLALTNDLREAICGTLRLEPEQINFDDDLARYGFDSISFSELATRLNDKFDLDITPAIFFGYTYLHELRQGLIDEYGDHLTRHYASRSAVSELPTQTAVKDPEPVVSRPPAGPTADSNSSYPPVAIIGMSTRLPGSADSDEFWEHLRAGDDLVSEIPEDRWNWRAIHGETSSDRQRTPFHHGAFMTGIDRFDPYFFGIAGTDAELMDPQERLMLEEAWHALENAGIDPTSLAGSDTGVFVGVSTGDYKELLIKRAYPNMLTQTMVPNRIAYTLNLHGPSLVVDTACSSAAVAVHQAVEQIQQGRCHLALAGGVNVICSPSMYITQGRMNMLSPDGSCKTFDSSANGYVRGEGCGVVVLKPLDAALADGDRILGIIRGSAVNHGGMATNLFAPNEAAQSDVVRTALTRGAVPASAVSYIESHGTGTPLGDPIEVNGLKRAYRILYGAEQLNFDEHDPPVYLGAVKTNTGHLEAASALPGLLKILFSFERGIIPRNIHFSQVNPQLQIEHTPFKLATTELRWDQLAADRPGGVRMAGLSSFGIGGVNAHLVLEAPPALANGAAVSAPGPLLLPVSARTRDQLLAYVVSLRTFVAAHVAPMADDFLAGCAASLGFSSVNDLDLSIPLEDYGADPIALAKLVGQTPSARVGGTLDPRMTLAELARRISGTQDGPIFGEEGFLTSLCYVFQTGRTRFGQRVAFVFTDAADLLNQMDSFLADPDGHKFFGTADKHTAAPRIDTSLGDLARSWVTGAEIDFTSVPGCVVGTKIAAPGYPFERQRFWFTDFLLDEAEVEPEEVTVVCAETTSALTGHDDPNDVAPSDVASTITAVLSRLLKVPLDQIEPTAQFADFGLDSIRLIQFGSELSEVFGMDCDPSLIMDHPTVETLASAIGALVVADSGGHGRWPTSAEDGQQMADEGPGLNPGADLRLNYPVQLSSEPVMLVSAYQEFNRKRVVGFWRDLKAGISPELKLSAIGPQMLAALRACGYRYFHYVVRNAAGQHAEVYVAGEGKPLLIIIGIGMAPSFAAYQIEALAGKRQIIYICMPGVGLSPMIEDLSLRGLGSFVLGALDELGVDQFDILGVSWGSLLAVTLAWLQPERVTNLVLISPNADMGAVDDPGKYVTGIDDAMTRDFSVVEGGDQARQFYEETECLETRAFLRWSKYFGSQTVSRHETLSILPEVTQRSLVIVGARDTIIEPREAEVVALYLRNCTMHVISDASHLPLVTHPELINDLVDRFLDGSEVERTSGPRQSAPTHGTEMRHANHQ